MEQTPAKHNIFFGRYDNMQFIQRQTNPYTIITQGTAVKIITYGNSCRPAHNCDILFE